MDKDQEVDDFLEHYGVKGMRWGTRKSRDGVSRKTDREARKDAQEFARAKMYFGKGAGTRRKLINNTVEARRRRDPDYGRAFDRHLRDQDMSTHASGARSERRRTDRRERTRQRAGYVARRFTGEMGTQAAFIAAGTAGAAYLASPRGRAATSRRFNQVQTLVTNQRTQMRTRRLLNTLLQD